MANDQYDHLLAELIRRAVDRVYGTARPDDVAKALDASFGSWTDRDDDGETYVDDLRRGMARRLTT